MPALFFSTNYFVDDEQSQAFWWICYDLSLADLMHQDLMIKEDVKSRSAEVGRNDWPVEWLGTETRVFDVRS